MYGGADIHLWVLTKRKEVNKIALLRRETEPKQQEKISTHALIIELHVLHVIIFFRRVPVFTVTGTHSSLPIGRATKIRSSLIMVQMTVHFTVVCYEFSLLSLQEPCTSSATG